MAVKERPLVRALITSCFIRFALHSNKKNTKFPGSLHSSGFHSRCSRIWNSLSADILSSQVRKLASMRFVLSCEDRKQNNQFWLREVADWIYMSVSHGTATLVIRRDVDWIKLVNSDRKYLFALSFSVCKILDYLITTQLCVIHVYQECNELN